VTAGQPGAPNPAVFLGDKMPIEDYIEYEVEVHKVTEKAIYVDLIVEDTLVWIPRSVLKDDCDTEGRTHIMIAKWWLKKNDYDWET
jgi:hypothetical protein